MASRLEMSQVEYAQHRGVTKQAIHDLIKRDKIELVPSEDDPRRMVIDVAAADRALGETRERINSGDDDAPRGDYVPPADGGGAGGRLTAARTATEVYRARLAQLEYDEKVGKLLRRDDVELSMRVLGDALARGLDAIAGAAAELAAAFREGEESGLRTALKKMVRREQATVVENLKLFADDAPPAAAS
jgi:hypothetical protein